MMNSWRPPLSGSFAPWIPVPVFELAGDPVPTSRQDLNFWSYLMRHYPNQPRLEPVAVFNVNAAGRPLHAQTITLPIPNWINETTQSHPHHIEQHPSDSIFYVPDLGRDVVYVLEGTTSRGAYGQGPKTGVISPNGRTYYLSFQLSSTVLAVPVNRRGMLQSPTTAAISSLPPPALSEQRDHSSATPINISSDVLLFDNPLLVANRRVKERYPAYVGDAEDTIAVFEPLFDSIELRGHIHTGCWKPREMMRVRGNGKDDHLAVTCNGQSGQGGGVILVDMNEPYQVVGRWDSGHLSVGGIVGLTTSIRGTSAL